MPDRVGHDDYETVPGSAPTYPRERRDEDGPHRCGHAERVRLPDALRPQRRLPAADHQEGPPQIDHPRAPLVHRRGYQHQVSQGQRRDHLGRVGGRERGPGAGLRPSVALLARAGRPEHRPALECHRHDPQPSRQPPPAGDRLESRRGRQDGPAALPLPLPVLCGGRETLLPVVSAQRGRVPRPPC